MKRPMPTLTHLNKARKEFKAIEPRDFFYWSVTKLVAAVLVAERSAHVVDELVRALLGGWVQPNVYIFWHPDSSRSGMQQF